MKNMREGHTVRKNMRKGHTVRKNIHMLIQCADKSK